MERSIFINDFSPSLCISSKYGDGDTCPIDQSPSQKFNIDPLTGRPIDDLTALLKAKPLDRERILANMEAFREDFSIPPTDNVADLAKALVYSQPRLAQLPSELAELAEFVASRKLEERRKAEQADFLKKLDEDMKEVEDDKDKVDDNKPKED